MKATAAPVEATPFGVEPPPRITKADVAEAYARGVAEGRAQTLGEHEEAMRKLADSMERFADEAYRSIAEAARAMRAQVVELGIEVGRWLLAEAVSEEPELMRPRIEAALEGIAGEPEVRLCVAPALVDAVARWVPAEVEVAGDPSLEPGDLVLRTGGGVLVGTADDALARLREVLAEDPGA